MYISIRHKIAATLFVSVFVLTLLMSVLGQFLHYQEFKDHIRSDAEVSVRLAIGQANRWFADNMTAANLLGFQAEKFAETEAEGVIEDALISAADQIGLMSVYIGMDDGRFASRNPESELTAANFKESEWYREAKKQRKTFFINPTVSSRNGKYFLTFGAPLFGAQRLFAKGAVGFDVPLGDLKNAVGGIFVSEVGGVEVFPIKESRYVIFVRPQAMEDADFILFKDQIQETLPEVGAILPVQKGKYLAIFDNIPDTPLVIFYPISVADLARPLIKRALFVTGITTLGLFAIFQVVLMLMGRFVNRIQALKAKAQDISEGDFKTRVEKIAEDEIGDLGDSFNQMAEALVNYMEKLKETTRTKERLNREMELAAEIQKNALPDALPIIEGVDISASTLPAYEVGGDYYDFLYPEKGTVGFVIADAAGKGFPGTLFMTNSRSVFRVISTEEKSPDKLLNKMNDFIATNSTSGMFITLLYCIYEIKTKMMTMANAGHYPPLIYRSKEDRFIELKTGGIPIGILPGQVYETESIQLNSGDILTLFTDGAVESMNPEKEMFELKRMEQVIRLNASSSSEEISKRMAKAIKDFSKTDQPFDDTTLLVMKIL